MTTFEESLIKSIRFEHPDFIPMTFSVNPSSYYTYDTEALFDLMEEHRFLFPGFIRPPKGFKPKSGNVNRKGVPYTDDFGCVWETTVEGMTGTVTGHPLEDWNAFKTWKAPDPSVCMGIGSINWDDEAARIGKYKADRHITRGSLRHGHTFLQLSDLRGYMNLIFDMADEEPRLWKLIEKIEEFNQYIVDCYLDMNVDIMEFAEDLGMQQGPMVSPEHFVKYIKPSYSRLMKRALQSDTIVHMHSDGDIRALADELVDSGVQVLNLQDLVNGIEWIRDKYKGKLCIELDLDRQSITRYGTPEDIEKLIKYEVLTLGDKSGGFAMIFGLYPGTPLENVKAVMDAMEKYSTYYA
ncbi:MAG: hypothetical protein GX633_04480 [Clostridiales bacterium]|nr:hypothetical protein [Clostridiales bacterium]